MKEQALIDCITRKCPSNASIIVGIGDDAAVIHLAKTKGLVCADMLMDGVHFISSQVSPASIGHKALAVNLSDIAAMGGRALSAYVSLALPINLAQQGFIDEFYGGMGRLASQFGVAIAGGDTNIWSGPLVVNVTVFGETHAQGAILRSGAKVGDKIFVTGSLGGSLSSHHLHFTPRLGEAKELLDHFHPTSMMDVSDGLAKDLRDISRQSGVALVLDRTRIPLREEIRNLPNALKRALTDGEDFELCFTLCPAESKSLETHKDFSSFTCIGEVRQGQGLYWMDDGSEILWQGYQHGVDA